MTQYPPPLGTPYQPTPFQRKGNGLAVASLIFSAVGICVLYVGGIVGIILGILGLRKARDPEAGGKGLAVAGIVVGILSLITSVALTYVIAAGVRAAIAGSEPPRAEARQFVQDLAKGDTQSAATQVTGDISPDQLAAMSAKLQPLGTFVDMTSNHFNMSSFNGRATCNLQGTARFSGGTQSYDITLVHSNSTWKVSGAEFP